MLEPNILAFRGDYVFPHVAAGEEEHTLMETIPDDANMQYEEVKHDVEFKQIRVEIPEGANIVIGQTHFIKTAEDLYEAMINSAPTIKFGVAFCEASGPCLVRVEGNDPELKSLASRNAFTIGAGHCFVIIMKGAFPINVLQAVKNCVEVCSIFCATANSLEVIIAETELGRSILGVVDGEKPKGIETEEDARHRKDFLRKIGYKL